MRMNIIAKNGFAQMMNLKHTDLKWNMMIYAVNMKKEGEKMNNFFGFMGFKNYKRLLKTTTKKDYGIYLELKKQKKGKLK